MSAAGGIGTSSSAVFLYGSGHFFAGALVATFFVLFDLLDGTMARISESTSRWGALLDSTLDRVADAAILGSIAYWLNKNHDSRVTLLLLILISGSLISYIKARAEALDIACDGGIAERTERLIIILIASGFYGLGKGWIFSMILFEDRGNKPGITDEVRIDLENLRRRMKNPAPIPVVI